MKGKIVFAVCAWIASREAMKSESCQIAAMCFIGSVWIHGWMKGR